MHVAPVPSAVSDVESNQCVQSLGVEMTTVRGNTMRMAVASSEKMSEGADKVASLQSTNTSVCAATMMGSSSTTYAPFAKSLTATASIGSVTSFAVGKSKLHS